MRAYVLTTGIIFGLLVLAHLWRATVETHLAKDPVFLFSTALAVAFTAWAARLLWRSRASAGRPADAPRP